MAKGTRFGSWIRTVTTSLLSLIRALGTHDNKEIIVEGRVQFDLLELVRRDHKLKSYSLNYVSYEFLKEQKVRLLR